MPLNKEHKIKIILLALVILAGFIILSPHFDFQKYVAQGDHGQNLLRFRDTYNGALPFKDYRWGYGPLMPFYYAASYHLMGVGIKSTLIAQNLLIIAAAGFLYLAIAVFLNPLVGLVAGVWFLVYYPDFFYTYNHTGVITLQMAATYLLFLYIKDSKIKYFFIGSACVFLMMLIKLNFGVFSLLGFIVCIFMINHFKKIPFKLHFYLVPLLLVPAAALLIYWLLFKDLPGYAVAQCFGLFNTFYYHPTIFTSIKSFFKYIIIYYQSSFALSAFGLILILLTLRTAYIAFSPKEEGPAKRNILLMIACTCIFLVLNSHEYFGDSRFGYRFHWIIPFQIVLTFIIIGLSMNNLNKNVIYGLMFAILLLPVSKTIDRHSQLRILKNSYQFLEAKTANIYMLNSHDWQFTVYKTLAYLEQNLRDDETFFALPYDSLYYYLLEKKCPTWIVLLTEAMEIPEEQERTIIADLEKENVNYVLLSNRNRGAAVEPGIGEMGKTYLHIVHKYIMDNFELQKTYGTWETEPTWVDNHAVRIYKRKGI